MFEPRERFIVVRNEYHPPAVILGDWQFWADHEAELEEWCQSTGARRTGMTVEMTEDVLMLFTLRWS
jgi:hypothetical protein